MDGKEDRKCCFLITNVSSGMVVFNGFICHILLSTPILFVFFGDKHSLRIRLKFRMCVTDLHVKCTFPFIHWQSCGCAVQSCAFPFIHWQLRGWAVQSCAFLFWQIIPPSRGWSPQNWSVKYPFLQSGQPEGIGDTVHEPQHFGWGDRSPQTNQPSSSLCPQQQAMFQQIPKFRAVSINSVLILLQIQTAFTNDWFLLNEWKMKLICSSKWLI